MIVTFGGGFICHLLDNDNLGGFFDVCSEDGIGL